MSNSIEQSTSPATEIDWLRRYAWLLDSSVRLPFGRTIGIGSLLGVVPVVGDVLGAGFSSLVLLKARQLGVSKTVQVRMLANIALDTLVGAVPFAGDLFDFAFKANERNVALLVEWTGNHETVHRRSRRFLLTAIFAFIVTAGVALATIVLLLRALLRLFA